MPRPPIPAIPSQIFEQLAHLDLRAIFLRKTREPVAALAAALGASKSH